MSILPGKYETTGNREFAMPGCFAQLAECWSTYARIKDSILGQAILLVYELVITLFLRPFFPTLILVG
ncbi:hypothetical protein DPMN_179964 [Dreissena polymorpha]|uniref:Uncharacterized protein n=1 Tax=Dreissena polymorpha TaxID=45954 RepID=A0A9D4EI34_DREPO|nr:hypothetical protein DPMN_179964 [Dreissena polymorpha]